MGGFGGGADTSKVGSVASEMLCKEKQVSFNGRKHHARIIQNQLQNTVRRWVSSISTRIVQRLVHDISISCGVHCIHEISLDA